MKDAVGCQCIISLGVSNHNKMSVSEGVKGFLETLGLVQYFDLFLIKGYDREDDICGLSDADMDAMMIVDPDHRRQILGAARCFKPSDEFRLFEFLQNNGLEHYYVSFIQSELTSIEDLETLHLPDNDLYDELEITLPGHMRRLERAVSKLRKRLKLNPSDSCMPNGLRASPSDIPVAHGRWGKPACLEEAKFDFLVVDAKIRSTKESEKVEDIEFMVDSGSDVTTVREEVLKGLDLELLGRIHSKGVHGSKTTNLYKAVLQIGSQELQIEVMGESYDSLGSRVVRHFKHFIDGQRHIWMKSNYCEPDMVHPKPNKPLPSLASSSNPSSSKVHQSVHKSSSSSSTSSSSSSSSQTSQFVQPLVLNGSGHSEKDPHMSFQVDVDPNNLCPVSPDIINKTATTTSSSSSSVLEHLTKTDGSNG